MAEILGFVLKNVFLEIRIEAKNALCDFKITCFEKSLLSTSKKLTKIFSISYFKKCLRYNRSSRLEVFCRKGDLRNFEKFKGKHLYQSLFFNKVAGLRPTTLLKKKLLHRFFPVNFSNFLRTPFVTEHFRWLLLI